MRFVKISLLCAVMVLTLSASGWTQVIGCDDLIKSSFDQLRIKYTETRPGDTALIPIMLNHDSIVTSFQFLVEYDPTYLTPLRDRDSSCASYNGEDCVLWDIDTNYVQAVIGGRFVKDSAYQGPFGTIIDTVTKFRAAFFPAAENVVSCNFLPQGDDFDSLAPPEGTLDSVPIFYLKFLVNPATPESTLCQFTFYEHDIWLYDDTANNGLGDSTQIPGCYESQMSTAWWAGDSSATYLIYPQTNFGYGYYLRVTNHITTPPTVSLNAVPDSITTTQFSDLTWSSANADSVVVRRGSTRVTGADNGETSGSIRVSGLAAGTYSYVATAYNAFGTGTSTDTLLVTQSITTGPIITTSGVQASYNQGELISFTVTATNTNSSQITLSATSLPANASFGISNQVTGYTPLTGTFTWTPDFNQQGQYVIVFQGIDGGGQSTENVILNIEELEYDRLFSTSAKGNRPVGGLPGTREIRFPIDLITAQTVYAVQFDMDYPSSFLRVDSFLTSDRIPEYVVYDDLGQVPGHVRVFTFGLANEPVDDTNTTAVLYAMMTLDSGATPWSDAKITLTNGWESVSPDPNIASLPLVTDSGVVEVDHYGDVNLDRHVNVADVVNIVAYIIGNFGLTPRQFGVADIAVNDSVNVFDLVADINMVFDIDAVPQTSPAAPGQTAEITLAYDDLNIGGSEPLRVASELPTEVAGAQFEINYDPAAVILGKPVLTEYVDNFILQSSDNGSGRMKILMYHMAPHKTEELIAAGVADLVEIPITAKRAIKSGDKNVLRLTEALLANSQAASIAVNGVDIPLPTSFVLSQNYPNPFNPTTIIEYSVGVSESFSSTQHVSLDIFNILGQHVTNLVDKPQGAGNYSVEWNATDGNGQRVATGIYLYRLRVGDESKTKKMLFLK